MELQFFQTIVDSDTMTIMLRIVLAAILGGIVGVEREYNKHPAGFKTHLLVSVGACLIMLISIFGFESFIEENAEFVNFDPSRLASYVVSGIGFLGAGTILVQGNTIRGLTTAASIWVIAGIGLSIGVGMYFAAIFTTVIVSFSLIFLNKIEDKLFKKKREVETIVIHAKHREKTLLDIITIFEENKVVVKNVMVKRDSSTETEKLIKYQMKVVYPNPEVKFTTIDQLYKMLQVHKVYSL